MGHPPSLPIPQGSYGKTWRCSYHHFGLGYSSCFNLLTSLGKDQPIFVKRWHCVGNLWVELWRLSGSLRWFDIFIQKLSAICIKVLVKERSLHEVESVGDNANAAKRVSMMGVCRYLRLWSDTKNIWLRVSLFFFYYVCIQWV